MQRKRIHSSHDLHLNNGGTLHLLVYLSDGRFEGRGAVRRPNGSIAGQLIRSEAATEDELIMQMLQAANFAY